LPAEIATVRERLPADVHLVVGGALAVSRKGSLEGEGVEILPTFEALREKLRNLGAPV